ncbi:MAG TPA: penicillin-binding protein 1C, partial [Acidobacteriota bacterium]|nr:penicillin-binding protein 1C [Acidobacteriota bacterium]
MGLTSSRIKWMVAAVLAMAGAWGVLWWGMLPEVESFESVREGYSRSEAVLLSRRGEVLQEVRIDLQARRLRWTPLAEISPALKEAVMKAEDRRF